MASRKACKHCGQVKLMFCRGLCWKCGSKPAIRDQYPLIRKKYDLDDPTAEELERMVAEQAAKLPAWWDAEEKRKLQESPEIGLPPPVLVRGRGLKRRGSMHDF
jgi:hypothetical protein